MGRTWGRLWVEMRRGPKPFPAGADAVDAADSVEAEREVGRTLSWDALTVPSA